MSKKKNITDEMLYELYFLISSAKTPEECRALLEDLCSQKELEQMAQRVLAARLLAEGKTYNQVTEETDISSATLSRVSRCLHNGNGYAKFIKK